MGILSPEGGSCGCKTKKTVSFNEDRNEVKKFTKYSDPFGEEVLSLSDRDFANFLESKDAVLVMFHGWVTPKLRKTAEIVNDAALLVTKDDHVFAHVDCTEEKELCEREAINKFQMPVFKLFRSGKLGGSTKIPVDLSAEELQQIVEG